MYYYIYNTIIHAITQYYILDNIIQYYTLLHNITCTHYFITQYYILPLLLTTPLLIISVTTSPADCNNLTASSIDLFSKLSPLIARILSPTCRA